jgi:hypothetical protein
VNRQREVAKRDATDNLNAINGQHGALTVAKTNGQPPNNSV